MLLNIYLGTTAISWAIVDIFAVACKKRFEREGYKFVNPKKSFAEELASFISMAFKGFLPVYNVLNAILIIYYGDDAYEAMKYDFLKEGKVYMSKTKPQNTNPEIQSSQLKKEQSNTDSIQKVNVKKKYEDMSFEEKIAYLDREKEILLRQKENVSDESLSEDLGQQVPELKITFNPERK